MVRCISTVPIASMSMRQTGAEKIQYVPAQSQWWFDCARDHIPQWDMDLLTAFDLDSSHLEQAVSRLSTGQKQRLALVRALSLKTRSAITR